MSARTNGRNYAKARRGPATIGIVFFNDTADDAIPKLLSLCAQRSADKAIELSMFKRSADPELERYRLETRIGIVGEMPEDGSP